MMKLINKFFSSFFQKRLNIIILIFSASLIPQLIFADGGMISWPSRFDAKINLVESAQNAIVAWNGEEEILILSNDIASSESGTILRMVPLPSNPTRIEEGSFDSFQELTEIVNKKGKILQYHDHKIFLSGPSLFSDETIGVEITFSEKIGMHDVTVVKVNDLNDFLKWINDFAMAKGLEPKEISPEFQNGILDYLNRDIRYFVFDVIEKSQTEQKADSNTRIFVSTPFGFVEKEANEQSITPLIYRFQSDYLFYPLKITAISEIGESQALINLFLISNGLINEETIKQVNLKPTVDFNYYISLNKKELQRIDPILTSFFRSNPFVVLVGFSGNLNQLNKDLVISKQNLHLPTLFERINHFGQYLLFKIEKFFSSENKKILSLFIGEESFIGFWGYIFRMIFLMIVFIAFLFTYFTFDQFISEKLSKKHPTLTLINVIAFFGSFVITICLFYIYSMLLAEIQGIGYFGPILAHLIGIVVCFIVIFYIEKLYS